MAAFCSSCGTQVDSSWTFCRSCGGKLSPSVSPPSADSAAVPRLLPQEKFFMQDVNGVTVTTARIITPQKTYALANVSSVTLNSRHPHSTAGLFLILLGLLVLVVGASMGSTGGGLLLGGALFVLGIILVCSQKFVVVVRAAGGEYDTYASTNREFTRQVTQAIEQAIVARG